MDSESRSIDTFIDAFCRKVAHIVVESRLGKQIKTPCKNRADPSDWFNLSTDDVPEVVDEVQRLLKSCGDVRHCLSTSSSGATDTGSVTFCVEISLRTSDGVSLVLEYWRLALTAPPAAAAAASTPASVSQTASQLGLLLKSLLVTTRLTRAYKLSRQQNQESHVILYKVFLGEPDLTTLGDSHERLLIGAVDTCLCRVSLALDYRTRMTVSAAATDTASSPAPLVKSEHFRPDMSPRAQRMTGFTEQRDSESVEMTGVSSSSSSNMETKTAGGSSTDSSEHRRRVGAFACDSTAYDQASPTAAPSSAPAAIAEPGVPFARLLSMASSVSAPTTSLSGDVSMSGWQQSPVAASHTTATVAAATDPADDFVMVDLKPPFSDTDSADIELGQFFRRAPTGGAGSGGGAHSPASPAPSISSGDERGVSVGQQLLTYHSKSKEYDDLIAQLAHTDIDDKTGD